MHKNLLAAWPLFFGVAMIMIGNGLQSTLLGVRADLEDFSVQSTGAIMSMYFVGYLLGSHYAPKLIRGVGHIRVFAALASIASTTVLFHGLFPNEWIWAIVRLLTGVSYAGLYIVIESWLNNAVDNKGRGQMMALYLVVMYVAMAFGQYLLNVADPSQMDLFVITSVLVSLALIPISLSSRPAPHFGDTEKVSIQTLWKQSHLGVYGVFASGMAGACLFSIGPLYAVQAGLTLPEVSTFIAAAIVGGILLQFPIGWASDKFDRRKVLIAAAAMTAFFCFLAILLATVSVYALYLAMFLLGGTALTIYGLSTSHTNDHLQPAQIVAASATMIMINGVGSILGPLLSASLMGIAPSMFFAVMGTIYGSIAVYGLYRASIRPPVPLDQQGDFVPVPSPSTGMVMQQVAEQTEEAA